MDFQMDHLMDFQTMNKTNHLNPQHKKLLPISPRRSQGLDVPSSQPSANGRAPGVS